MSFLIKDLKMPPKGEYKATIYVHGDGKAYIDFDDASEMSAYTGLFAQCELVEVPPHGRLIDADALYAEWLDDGENECIYDTNAFLYSISGAPTIIDKD